MAARGFTLVELLVVLGIIALVISVAAPIVSRGLPGAALKTATSDVANGLRRAQSAAIMSNSEVVFRVDVDDRRFTIGPEGEAQQLPAELTLSLVVGDSEARESGIGGIRFFPDGSSTGGQISLAMDARKSNVSVDWLTGRIRVRQLDRADAQ